MSMHDNQLREVVEAGWDERDELRPGRFDPALREALDEVLARLERGELRVAEPGDSGWQVNAWVKQAILLHFRISWNRVMRGSIRNYFDKVELRFTDNSDAVEDCGARVVPPATVRQGAFIGKDVVLMPSYVNIGAWVGPGSMIDTWATVGSCAQIGANVHISGGAGIGGVLEPLQANPTIIGDNCFIGARSEIVEGVIVGEGSVVAMGVFITQSTKIVYRDTGEVIRGHIPPYSVVVPGTMPGKDGGPGLACAVIVKTVDAQTREKTGINDLLRD